MNVTLLSGILISLLYSEVTGLSPGGLIVPAYFAMYDRTPLRLFETIVLSLVCMLIVRGFSHIMILYGRRRYAVFILTGVLLKVACQSLIPGAFHPIGILIPGILGREMERQGILLTLLSLGITVLLIHFLLILLAAR